MLHTVGGEAGQDMVEYALVLALIALAAVATTQMLALDINEALDNIGLTLSSIG